MNNGIGTKHRQLCPHAKLINCVEKRFCFELIINKRPLCERYLLKNLEWLDSIWQSTSYLSHASLWHTAVRN